MINEIIQQAKEKYPLSVYFKGKLSEKEIAEIEKTCDIHSTSVFIDGTSTFSIRYKKRENLNGDI